MEKILYIVEKLVHDIAGSNALRLLKELLYKENISEIKLAENLKMGVNEVRALLYKLHAYNLVYSIRKKDKEKGWYIYYWSFNFHHARDLLIIKNKKKLKKLKEILGEDKDIDFYECKNKCIKAGLGEALNLNFRCPECGQLLIHKKDFIYLEKIKKDIITLEDELEILKQPIKVIIKKEMVKKKKIKKAKVKPRKFKKKVVKKVRAKKKKSVGEARTKKKSGKLPVRKKMAKKSKAKKKLVKVVKPSKKKKVIKKTKSSGESIGKKKGFFSKLKRKIKF